MTLRFLLLDKSQEDASVIKAALSSGTIDCQLLRVETISEFIAALDSNIFDLVLADITVLGFDALSIARNKIPGVPFIFVSSSLDEKLEIEALKSGATDYVLKQRLGRLAPIIQRALPKVERRSSLVAPHEHEARLRAVAANLPNAAVFIVDNNLRYLLAEGQALLGAGVTSHNLVGKTLWEALDSKTATYYEPYYRQALGGEPFSLEHYSHGRYYISHGTPLYNEQGEIDAALVVSYDNTIRKQAELNIEFLANVSQDLVRATTVEEIVQTIGERLNRYLNISICVFTEINEEAQVAVNNYDWHQNDTPSLVGVHSIPEFVSDEFLQAAKAGQPIVVRDVNNDPRVVDASRFAALKIGAELNIPIVKDGEWKFSLSVFHQTAYNWRPSEIELMQELANRIWFKLERARAEEALRESEEQSRHILESINDGFLALDENWLFTYVNKAGEMILERASEELIGKNFWEEYPGIDGSEFGNLHRRVATERVAGSLIEYYPHHKRWYEVRSYPAAKGITIYFRNVTDQIQAENALRESSQALRQSESRFRLMVESAKDYAIFTLSLDNIITSWNSGAQRLLGYQETEIIGCNGRIIFTPEDNEQQQAEREMQLALTQGRAENERWHVRKDGSRFWASGLIMPLLSEAGNTEGFVKILQDKTAQRQADRRLQLLYETTRDLLATPQPMQLMSNLFNKLSTQLQLDFYYHYMVEKKDNQLMLHLKNYEGISEQAAQSIEWIEFGEYLCGMVAQERRQIVFEQAKIVTHPNAQSVYSLGITAYAGQPLIVHGRLLGTLSFASRTRSNFTPEEIDLLQSTCEQIAIAIERANLITSIQQQAEQLQQANRIKDEFLAVLSHELRSPLNPILGWSKLLQTGKLDAAKTAQGLSVIERNAKLQSELIEDLLDVSRILQGKLALNVMNVDLAPTIQAAMETVQLAAQVKSIQINTNLDLNVGQVSGDANRLQQIIWNLLSNAVKFTNVGGQVDIELKQNNNTAQILVKDNGIGIKPDFLPSVFDYFRQEDGATTRKFGGLGLGLAIVRHLVELHGGTVYAESLGEGHGATFTVTLPLIQNPNQTNLDSNSSDRSLNLDGIKVLVVDDDTDTREFIAFMLDMYGASVTAAGSGAEALTIFSQDIPNILVSDIGMPDMDGYMLMQQIRALPKEQGGLLPAIALTAFAGEINQQQALQAGFQKHISKPIEPETLITAITQLL
ncbi:multi-sensor hybrid histidine kinase [Calothrix sp. NIES-4071]|nr:multi-sensor hybrid histidine kinase [Calothrix sp. NIES-4071]BAZ55545.1 multi-sensor hybrid histidine kinase [Calothrix sp. NIES-4105]